MSTTITRPATNAGATTGASPRVIDARRNPKRDARGNMSALFDSDEENPAVENERPKKKRRVVKRAFKPKGIFPFLKLPGELRNEVYELIVINHQDDEPFRALHILESQQAREKTKYRRDRESAKRISMGGSAVVPKASKLQPKVYPAILATNKQVRDEAKGILYSQNKFAICLSMRNWENLMHPTGSITPQGWDFSMMTNLHVELVLASTVQVNMLVNWEALFSQMASLKNLTISLTRGPNHYQHSDAMQTWANVDWTYKAFLRAFICALPLQATVTWDFRHSQNEPSKPVGHGHRRVKPSFVKSMWADLKYLQGVNYPDQEAEDVDITEDVSEDEDEEI